MFDKVTGILAVKSAFSSLSDQPEIRTSFIFLLFCQIVFTVSITMVIKWSPGGESGRQLRNLSVTRVVPAWPRRMLLLGSVQANDRSNWYFTTRDVHLFKMNCKLWLACVYLSESRFGAIQKGVCVCHWRPEGLHAHVPHVKDISSRQVKNANNLQQDEKTVDESGFVHKQTNTKPN